jgi:hypothetical protein
VKRQAIFLARWAGRGAFKATALVLAFVIIMALWLWNASLLTTAADQNLRIIKTLTQLLPAGWASKAESALRIFGADRALLLVQGIASSQPSLVPEIAVERPGASREFRAVQHDPAGAPQTPDCPALGVCEAVIGSLPRVIQLLAPRQRQPAPGLWIDILRIHGFPSTTGASSLADIYSRPS